MICPANFIVYLLIFLNKDHFEVFREFEIIILREV